METNTAPAISPTIVHGGDESVKGSRFLLLLIAGVMAQPGNAREQDVRQEFQTALGLVDQGRTSEATVAFRAMVARHPEVSEAWNNLAALEASRGDLEAARQALRMALECRQASQVALRNLDRVVGRMAREAWDSALSSSSKVEAAPRLDLVRNLTMAQDTSAIRRETDSLRQSIQRLSRDRDSLQGLRQSQRNILDSVRRELDSRQASLDQLSRREAKDRERTEELRQAYQVLAKRSDSIRDQMVQRTVDADRLRLLLTRTTGEADSLRKVLARREAESDSLRRTLAKVTLERGEARRDLVRKSSEVVRLRAESDGPREASGGALDASAGSAAQSPLTVVRAWASAWAARDAGGYLAFYSDGFAPPEGREAWEAKRRERLSIPDSIQLGILDPKLRKLPSGNVEVAFRQSYKAGETRLTTRKRLELRREVPGWKIVREESGAR